MKNRKTAVLLGAAALTAALGLGYGLLTGAEQAEESSSAAGVAAFSPTGAVSVICYENEGGEIALEYLDNTWTLRRDADFPVNQTSAESMAPRPAECHRPGNTERGRPGGLRAGRAVQPH